MGTTNLMAASRPKDSKLFNSEQLFENWRSCELVSSGFAVMSLVFATLDYELYYSLDRTHSNCAVKSYKETFRFLIVMCSIVALFFLVMRHYIKSIWKEYLLMLEGTTMVSKTFAEDFVTKYKKRAKFLKPILFFEVLLPLFQPYPSPQCK